MYNAFDVIGNVRFGNHGGNPHRAVNPVFNVRNACVAISHFCRGFGVAGVDISVKIGTNLRAYPFAIGVFVFAAFRRSVTVDKVDISNPFGCTIRILRLRGKPYFGNVGRSEISAVTL